MTVGKRMRRVRSIRNELFMRQGGRCCYCRKPMIGKPSSGDPRRPTIEHLRRKIEGGTDRRDNLAVACFQCNHDRGDRDWLTYASMMQGEVLG